MSTPHFDGLLVLDKPTGLTSRDAVNRAQKWFPRRTRIGHTGTLDPLATGVLVLCVGAATRLTEYVQRMEKVYRAVIRLGARSDTDDAEGTITPAAVAEPPDKDQVREALQSFVGEIEQAPPALTRRLFNLPRGRIAQRRRAHYEALHRLTEQLPGARPLFGPLPAQAAPYVMPLWVDEPEPAETVYAALRAAGCAVFRWDRVWPGVPDFHGDHGARWRTQVLQLLCHQDLDDAMLARTGELLKQTLTR